MLHFTYLGVASLGAILFAFLPYSQAATSYQLVQSSTGSTFFNNWEFYAGQDVNNTGSVNFLDQNTATQQQLISTNAAGNVIIKVDNTTSGVGNSTFGRNSIKILSQYTIAKGNLVIFDALHMPFGCSVWPAVWTLGPGVWPFSGEIDLVEGVNGQTQNRISLHTLDGCTHPDAGSSSTIETGNLVSTDCFNETSFNQGCIVEVPGASYGEAFAQAGGGVYAFLWLEDAMSFWFFPRGQIPSDVPTDSPNPSGWGMPTAFYPNSSCNFDQFFTPQTLIIDTTICGNFAGQPNVFAETCAGTCTDLVADPKNFDNAYFEFAYIKMFQQTNGTAIPTTTSSSGASGTGSGSSATSAPATNSKSNDAEMTTPVFTALSLLSVFVFSLL